MAFYKLLSNDIMNRQSRNRGKQLTFARSYRQLSQAKLCEEVKGLSQSNLSKFENGFNDKISDVKLKEIMEYLNFPFDWLDVPTLSPLIVG